MNLSWSGLRDRWPRTSGSENLGIKSLYKLISSGEINLAPEYQRSRVWTPLQASRFVGFIMEGGETPPLWLQRWGDGAPDEVIDGLQRISAVSQFLLGQIPMETTMGEIAFLTDFPEQQQGQLVSTTGGPTLKIQYVSYPNKVEVMKFYLRLNRGGTPHTDEEIDRVKALINTEETKP